MVSCAAPMRVYTGLDVWSDFGGRFPWKSRLIEVDPGVRQAVVDEGPRDAPLTFLLLHGNPTWGYLYREFIRRLSPRYRVIVPDHVGFGRSDKPRDPRWYTLERHIDNLGRVLRELQPSRVVPVIQDWGGPIGMGWATKQADRVAGVVVLNTWAFVRQPRLKLPWLFKFLVLGRGGWKRSVQKNLFVELFLAKGGPRPLSEEELEPYRAPFPTPDDRVGIGRFPQLIPETRNPFHESYATMAFIEDHLSRLRQKPALISWALTDRAFRQPQLERTQTQGLPWLTTMAEAVAGALSVPMERVHLKRRRTGEKYARLSRNNERIVVRENDLRFLVNLDDYIDTGLFADHRETRARVRAEARGAKFLNLFAYTGSFTCAAAAGGAEQTTSVDASQTYLDWAGANLELNSASGELVRSGVDEFLRSAGDRRWTLCVLDPPSFSDFGGSSTQSVQRRS